MSYSEDRNYYSDHRVRAANRSKWYTRLDTQRMRATIELDDEEAEVPFVFAVCPTCHGKGTHVNPSVDAGGLTAEDFYEDPDLAEDYFSGVYDVDCYECGGERVVPEIQESGCDPEILRQLREQQEEEADFRRMQEAERRYGA